MFFCECFFAVCKEWGKVSQIYETITLKELIKFIYEINQLGFAKTYKCYIFIDKYVNTRLFKSMHAYHGNLKINFTRPKQNYKPNELNDFGWMNDLLLTILAKKPCYSFDIKNI